MINTDNFHFSNAVTKGIQGKRVLITGAGKHGGLGQAFALSAGLNKAAVVGVHFYRSYNDGLETVEAINKAGGNAFPVQADVTNTSDVWSIRSYVIDKMGGVPPNLVICNSGLSESGYLLGRPPRTVEGESPALRRARTRQAFVDNLNDSRAVMNTKIDGFLAMTHLWAGEALHYEEPLQLVYVSSRQAVDPGAGVPGYVIANFGVLALPRVLRTNLGRHSDLVTALSVAYPFVRTSMTDAYADNAKVFGRWQPRMLETHEAAMCLMQLLSRPAAELDNSILQLNVTGDTDEVRTSWSKVQLEPSLEELPWSEETALTF